MTNDIIHRLAKACAHGPRQAELVDELLAGTAMIIRDHWGSKVGKAGVGYESWKSLKKRLKANGFIVTQETWAQKPNGDRKIEMRFEMNFSSP